MLSEAILIGYMIKKEIKEAKYGGEMAALEVHTDTKIKDRDGKEQMRSTLHKVSCFGAALVDMTEKLSEGDLIYVKGEIRNVKATDEYNKNPVYHYFVQANQIRLIKKSKG